MDVHGGCRKVGQAPGVVEVQVGRHDVADVVDAEAEVGDLAERRLGHFEPRPGERGEQETEPIGIAHVLDPEPGVDEDEPVLALDQQAMAAHRRDRPGAAAAAEQPSAARAQRPAVEMVDSHRRFLYPQERLGA